MAPPAAAPTAAAPAAPVVPVAPATPPAVSPPDASVAAPVASEPAASPSAPTDVPPADVDSLLTAFDEKGAELLQTLAPQFQLTQEQITELETDAAAAMPKLLANTYMKSMRAALGMVKNLVPQMVQQTIQRDNEARDMEGQFFKQWGQLNKEKHGSDIRSFAQAFAKASPGLSRENLFSMVGAAVMAKHGLQGGQTPPAPAAAMAPAPSFTPAVASAPVIHTQQVDQNPFAGMGMAYDED